MSEKPQTPYERFVAATKAIVSVPKKDVEKDMRAWKNRKRDAKRKRAD